MAGDDGVHITWKTVQGWKAQIVTLQKKVAAAELLLGADQQPPEKVVEADAGAGEADEAVNMTALIADISNSAVKPVPKSEMKEQLVAAGVARERLGKYFYVVIAKLKQKERITVQPDGALWKGSKYVRS